jgi:hypothetical protein
VAVEIDREAEKTEHGPAAGGRRGRGRPARMLLFTRAMSSRMERAL